MRGIRLPLVSGHCVFFDQELMRFTGLRAGPAGQPPVSLLKMAQLSCADAREKAANYTGKKECGISPLVTIAAPGADRKNVVV